MFARSLALTVAAFATLAGTAQAGTVSITSGTLLIETEPGEINNIRELFVNSPDFNDFHSVRDQVGLTPGANCRQGRDGPSQVECTDEGGTLVQRVLVRLKDGNDRFDSLVNFPIRVEGGAGNDTIETSYGRDELLGEDGDDVLVGEGESVSQAGPYVPDVFSGGPGTDYVSYATVKSAVTASLDGIANDGVPNENDFIQSDVEGISGTGNANNVLTGDAGPNGLFGGPYDDTITGLGGDDQIETYYGNDKLFGGDGNDKVEAGGDNDELDGGPGVDTFVGDVSSGEQSVITGNDTIRSRDGNVESISCGPGADTAVVDANDVLSKSDNNVCESVDGAAASPPGTPGTPPATPPGTPPTTGGSMSPTVSVLGSTKLRSVAASGLRAKLTCPAACQLKVRLTVGAKTAKKLKVPLKLASASRTLLQVGSTTVRLKPSKKVGARLRRSKSAITATLTVEAKGPSGTTTLTRKTVKLTR